MKQRGVFIADEIHEWFKEVAVDHAVTMAAVNESLVRAWMKTPHRLNPPPLERRQTRHSPVYLDSPLHRLFKIAAAKVPCTMADALEGLIEAWLIAMEKADRAGAKVKR